MIRLFIALALPDGTTDALVRLQCGLPGARWSARENLHLTPRFVGELDEPTADDLDAALEGVSLPPFLVEPFGVGVFDEGGGPTTVWAGVRPSASLSALKSRCDAACRRAAPGPTPVSGSHTSPWPTSRARSRIASERGFKQTT